LPAVLEPIVGTMQGILGLLQFLMGGIFGLYLLLVILKWRESRALKKVMTEVRDELVLIKQQLKKNETIQRRNNKSIKK